MLLLQHMTPAATRTPLVPHPCARVWREKQTNGVVRPIPASAGFDRAADPM